LLSIPVEATWVYVRGLLDVIVFTVHNYTLVTEMCLKILMLYTNFSILLNDVVSTIGATECRMRYIKQEQR